MVAMMVGVVCGMIMVVEVEVVAIIVGAVMVVVEVGVLMVMMVGAYAGHGCWW